MKQTSVCVYMYVKIQTGRTIHSKYIVSPVSVAGPG